MNNMFIFTDASKCIGCLNCELACAASHMGMSMEEALTSGKKLITRNRVVKVHEKTAPMQCMHCNNPSCLTVCPHDVIQHEGHFVKVYEEKCVGCGCCSLVCPYGAIKMVEQDIPETQINQQIAIKCDLCCESEDGPACVQICPSDAICLIDYNEYAKISSSKEQML